MKRELIESGRVSVDILKVESAEQVKRRIEIEKSTERLRDNMRVVERHITDFDGAIDRVERDLIPVVLSFLVGLKGNLVNMRTTIVGRSKRRAKTNLQATFIENEVKGIVDEEFSQVEETLTSGMSTPILEKVRDITEGLKENLKVTIEDFTGFKASLDDFSQRTATELEFLSKEVSMKPKVEIPKETSDKLKALERQVEELLRDLRTSDQKLQNRESEVDTLKITLAEVKARNESIEDQIVRLKAAPGIDKEDLAELRVSLKTAEASREVMREKMEEEKRRADLAEVRSRELSGESAKKDLEIQDLQNKMKQSQDEIAASSQRLEEMDELRARIRSYESGDRNREFDRITAELERTTASLDRLTRDLDAAKQKAEVAQLKIDSYLDLMEDTDKTKAFLMAEEYEGITVREIAKSLGVSPATVTKWAEDFVKLGIAQLVDGDKLKAMTDIG